MIVSKTIIDNILKFKKDTHQYFYNNEELTSVSVIINNYLGSDYDKVPKLILKNASVRGQWVHKVNEQYLKNIKKTNIIDNLLAKLKPLTNDVNYSYCEKSLLFLKEKFSNRSNLKFIIERPIHYSWVAGTPDLIYFDTIKREAFIVDYKCYAVIDKNKMKRIKLQLTGYYWILKKQGYVGLSRICFIYQTNKTEQKEISINITDEMIKEWETALKSHKEFETYLQGENKKWTENIN